MTESALRERTGRRSAPAKVIKRTGREPFDLSLLIIVLVLVVIGLVMVYSASYYAAEAKVDGNATDVFFKQLRAALIGFALMTFALYFDYHKLQNNWIVIGLMALSLVMLLLVLLIGGRVNGSKRWIVFPGLGSFQPSELAKFALALYMAKGMALAKDRMHKIASLVPFLIAAGAIAGLIILQPNLSSCGAILILTLIMLAVGGVRPRYFLMLMVVGAIAGAFLVWIEPYRLVRYTSFRDPWGDAKNTGYQLTQSLLGFGNGGAFGVGFGNSRQKFQFLPYADSDFIFSIIGEEFGFVGATVILILFAVLIFLGLRVALRCRDRFGSLLATGITAVVAIQVVINVAVATGAMPTTGLPLPFFSSGGTSMYVFLGAMGVLLNISRNMRRING